jgi:hypothetical protein
MSVDREETLTFKPKGVEQCNQLRVFVGPKKNAKSSRKNPDANYPASKFSWHIKKMSG